MPQSKQERWKSIPGNVVWEVARDTRLPHADHIEMSGRKVSVILHYRIDEERRLHLSREIIWPTLRTKEGDVRGYLRRTYGPESEPILMVGDTPIPIPPVQSINFYGLWRIIHEPTPEGIVISRILFPSMDKGRIVEQWDISHPNHREEFYIVPPPTAVKEIEIGVYGSYEITERLVLVPSGNPSIPSQYTTLEVYYEATCPDTPSAAQTSPYILSRFWSKVDTVNWELRARLDWRDRLWGAWGTKSLQVRTRFRVLNRAFDFALLRAAESLFETKMGLVHSPGGGRYYGGIWNNDQAEYSGPLFGYLGDADAKLAALTAYRNFAPYMTPEYAPIPTSLEMEGTIPIHAGGDRGDAAMYASGATRFALTTGDRAIAEELYPHIAWCLEYCRRKTNAAGLVESDCDELEKRFPAGDANLSTTCLYYDGLRRAADLARDLDKPDDADDYTRRADALETAIESHFGATVEGYETYRYYEGNTTLRAWICLPLVFGIGKRILGTLDALFSERMWSPDGLATEAGKPDFWDRSTLYALRGAFFAGDTERAYDHLIAYSRRRLLGEHVPYPVEAYPEGAQAHLSAESALYCRIFIEGILGMVPTGLRSFTLTPRLPAAWPQIKCTLPAFEHRVEIRVNRDGAQIQVQISAGKFTQNHTITPGDTVQITLPVR